MRIKKSTIINIVESQIKDEPKGFDKFINNGFKDFNFLLGKKLASNYYKIYCSHCEKWFISTDKPKQGKKFECKLCNNKYEYQHYNVFKNAKTTRYFSFTQEIKNGFIHRTYWVDKWINKDKNMEMKIWEIIRDVYIEGKTFKLVRYIFKGMNWDVHIRNYLDNWRHPSPSVDIDYPNASVYRPILQSKYKYSLWKQLKDRNPRASYIRYMYRYIQDRSVEFLVRYGLDWLIYDFYLDKQLLRKHLNIVMEEKFSGKELIVYNEIKDIELTKKMENYYYLIEFTNIKKLYYYLKKQNHYLSYWKDYINMAENIEIKVNHFPKDLTAAHDNILSQQKIMRNNVYDKNIKSQSKKLRKFIFENQKYLIRPIANINELITEGEKLNHCIGTYAKKYAKGQTIILAVRETKHQNEPLVTVEIKDNKIYQKYGKNNRTPKKDVLLFLKQYENQLNNNGISEMIL